MAGAADTVEHFLGSPVNRDPMIIESKDRLRKERFPPFPSASPKNAIAFLGELDTLTRMEKPGDF